MNDHTHDRRQHISISACPSGCVCLHFGLTMVHLPPGDFQAFVTLLLQALPEVGSHSNGARTRSARELA